MKFSKLKVLMKYEKAMRYMFLLFLLIYYCTLIYGNDNVKSKARDNGENNERNPKRKIITDIRSHPSNSEFEYGENPVVKEIDVKFKRPKIMKSFVDEKRPAIPKFEYDEDKVLKLIDPKRLQFKTSKQNKKEAKQYKDKHDVKEILIEENKDMKIEKSVQDLKDEQVNTKTVDEKKSTGVNINFFFNKGGELSQDYSINLPSNGRAKFHTDDHSSITNELTKTIQTAMKEKTQKEKSPSKEPKLTPLKLYQKYLKLEDQEDHEHHVDFDHNTVSPKSMEHFLYNEITKQLFEPLNQDDNPFVTIQKLGLSTFARLLQLSGLDHRLKNMNRNFTIFAPVDTAFRSLTSDHRGFLNNPENMEKLLLFHICPGRIYSNLFIKKKSLATMLNGAVINLKTSFNTQSLQSLTSIQSSNMIGGDISSNGSVIHIIDKLLFYPSRNILETIESDHRFKLFSFFLRNTTLRYLLGSENISCTAFIPKDSVILSVGYHLFFQDAIERLEFLHSHIYLDSVMYSNNFEEGIEYQLYMAHTQEKRVLTIRRMNKEKVKLGNRVFLVEKDLITTNGVIHTIDGLLG